MHPNATALPADVTAYRQTQAFTTQTIPAGLLADHATKAGVWGLLTVTKGCLRYRVTDPRRVPFETVVTNAEPAIIEPEIRHHVEAIDDVAFHVVFHRCLDVPEVEGDPDDPVRPKREAG
jgi:tellurite resistance-related uncharacterized protein